MKNDDNNTRIAKIAVAFGIIVLILLSAIVALGSFEIARMRESITTLASNNSTLTSKLDEVSKNTISLEQIAAFIPEDGKDGTNGIDGADGINGRDGSNGKDSLSTHTIEKETKTVEIIKEVPVESEKPNTGIEIGISLDGKIIWKDKSDRMWQLLPKVNIDMGTE